MLRKEHQIPVTFNGEKFMREFLNVHEIGYIKEYRETDIIFRMKMKRREFEALCEYLLDLNKLGVFPTVLS